MSDIAIRVENLGKQYRIGTRQRGYKTLRESLVGAFTSPFRRIYNSKSEIGNRKSEFIWALKDVSFDVKQSEIIGIIGRNGAGKSTLLKILSRITKPTEGRAEIHGRIGSLLEVGTGFHPELSGRENIYLNGAILGMKKVEIDRKFDEIVAFAEVEKFIDTPVKHYSSGMYVRLAFAVAAHLEPEILLVDEVLAVGDAAFQRKCLGKMGAVAQAGRTILFVSHNMGAIARLCERSLWFDDGGVRLDDVSQEVVNRYQSQHLTAAAEWLRPDAAKIDGDFAFLRVAVMDRSGRPASLLPANEPISVEIRYLVLRSLSACQIGARVYNSDGIVVMTTTDADTSGTSALSKEPAPYRVMFSIPGYFLAPGMYSIFVAAHSPGRSVYEVIEQTVVFEVGSSGSLTSLDGRLGVVAPVLPWEIAKEELQ
jgi:lipopolysaccharide transport system ATP-binding protein